MMTPGGVELKKRRRDWSGKLKRFGYRRLPVLEWAPQYSWKDAVSDFIAGLTICLTMLPQSIAYAALANLPPQYGLNSSFMGCLVYVLFGTVKEVVIGPSSLMSLLTLEYTHHLNSDFVILLTFLAGIVELLMALLKLGFVVKFIPRPVVSGFTTATAIIIIVSQLKGMIGVQFKSKGFVDNLIKLVKSIDSLNLGDLVLGILCLVILLSLKKLKEWAPAKGWPNKYVTKLFWYLGTGRNAITVFAASLVTLVYLNTKSKAPFVITKGVVSGLPGLVFPPTSTQVGNTTFTFPQMVEQLGSGLLFIPLVALSVNVAIAKAFKTSGVDATQEMVTLALSNVLGSFVQSMPVAGAFTRSAVISASGVRTPMAGLYSGVLTMLALEYLSPYFHLIPRAALSAILISAVSVLIDTKIFIFLWKSNKIDFGAVTLSLLGCLCFGVESGLVLGTLVSLLHLLYLSARPRLTSQLIQREEGSYIEAVVETGVLFPGSDYLNKALMNAALAHPSANLLVLDCSHITHIDFTIAKVLELSDVGLRAVGVRLVVLEPPEELSALWQSAAIKNIEHTQRQTLLHKLFGQGEEVQRKSAVQVNAPDEEDKLTGREETKSLVEQQAS